MTGMEEMYRVRWKLLLCNLGMIASLAIGRRGILGLAFSRQGHIRRLNVSRSWPNQERETTSRPRKQHV